MRGTSQLSLVALALSSSAVLSDASSELLTTFVDPPSPLCNTTACKTLELEYEKMRNVTCKTVADKAPVPSSTDLANFMTLYQNYTGGDDEAPVIAAAQKILNDPKVSAFLELPDSFGTGGLDAAMVLCAVLTEGTPTALAEFASNSTANKGLVTKLLANPTLMRDMLVAGGPTMSETDKGKAGPKHFGQAMAIYEQVLAASSELSWETVQGDASVTVDADAPWDDRSQENILKRFALGVALEHADTIHLHYDHKDCDEAYDWCPTAPKDTNVTTVDPVARYLHYENAYKAGDLDPAFEVLTVFETKHTCNSPASDEDLEWLRQSLAIYRPDHIAMSYDWRYAMAVRRLL